ncbi:iron ABC transporter permease [Sphingomonas sp. LY160]|uniref:FecCD family ABC transporter permease n=1 Tax=Sphingomonas sp. LY160 TaxID=3095342 RepID=UPI002ADEE946|nr:iron ABC transporter permease [Sphingomonas sp. LY160]MEA1071135.1 iron ABC transporter permease [Sphingomonas sp. LY160]
MKVVIAVVLIALGLAHLFLPFSIIEEAARVDADLAKLVLLGLRLPRTLLVLGYGAVLGIAGAALQAVFANPLASPDISGASSGAALGAVLGGYWIGVSQPLALAACGAVGAMTALGMLIALTGRRADSATLLLAGLAISLAAGAATSLALALAPSPFAFYDAFDWLMGNFADRSLAQAAAALVPATIASLLLLRRAGALDRLALGEDVAASLGVRPRALTVETIALSSIAVGACVSVAGAIGFVGLVAPILARRLSKGHPGRALVPAALIGAILLALSDLLVRSIPLDRPIPIGVVTALFGTPIFLWLVVHMRRRVTA